MSPALQEGDSRGLPFERDIAIRDPNWHAIIDDLDAICDQALGVALIELTKPVIGELSIALVDNKAMQGLNKLHRNKDKPTNVLAFPSVGPAPILGDIIVARETVVIEAAEKNIPAQDHFMHLLIHGFLHLQGYDHLTPADAEVMESIEIAALARLGIDNPYQIKEPSQS